MPLYEYLCEACGQRTETLQRLADPPLTVCAQCGGTLKKQFSAPSFQFKGSGWYVTDYARSGSGSAGGSEKSGAADAAAESKESAKSDKGEKGEKGEKSEKSEKAEKGEKGDRPAKSETPSAPAAPASPAGSKPPSSQ
jgi:putative FmdB family regulatory protein